MGLPYHRFMLSSGRLLLRHLRGEPPTVRQTLDLLFLDERDTDTARPDHVHKSLREAEFPDAQTCPDLLRTSLERLAEHYCEFRQTRLCIRGELFGCWQRLITRVPPLPVVTFALYREFGRGGLSGEDTDRVVGLLTANLSPSTLPTVVCPELDHMIETEGLADLHVHLTGTTEADPVWLNALDHPGAVYRNLRSAYRSAPGGRPQPVREQYDQIEEGLTPEDLYRRLRLARRVRHVLCEAVFGRDEECPDGLDLAIDRRPMTFDDQGFRVRGHPVRAFGPGRSVPDTVCEALFLWRVFERLHDPDAGRCAGPLHVYLLLMAQFMRFVVQQTDQKGFDQFQKITVNEFRSHAEQQYKHRFDQLARDARSGVRFLEGRFAPKETPEGNWDIIGKILRGYAMHHGARRPRLALRDPDSITERRPLRLGLVAHFIKSADEPMETPEGPRSRGRWRHDVLREQNHRKALALLDLHRRSALVRRHLVGVDAASNELHAPPEVFAPVFRRFRHHGFCHFTYHAGEDFRHPLSGMRAVIEAVELLDLRRGDRIGHATALGVDPALWWRRIGGRVVMPREDLLDDLVFAYRLLGEAGRMPEAMMALRDRIGREARAIHGGDTLGPDELIQAWRMRRHDPRMALDPDRGDSIPVTLFDRRELEAIAADRDSYPGAFRLFERWHSREVRERGRALVTVTGSDTSPALMAAVQRIALERIVDRGIVLEAMPTSNVRIGIYEDYDEHHILRWLGLRDDLPRPVVVLASDDPGIFANALRNEFIHLDRVLRTRFGMNGDEAHAHLGRLNRNARIHRFHPTDHTPRP